MAQGKKVVAIDIGGTKIASALVTLEEGAKPVVEFYDKIPTEAKKGGQQVLANAIKMARRVIELAGKDVCGIGVSSGGVIDPRTGDVTYANDMMPGWGGKGRTCGIFASSRLSRAAFRVRRSLRAGSISSCPGSRAAWSSVMR